MLVFINFFFSFKILKKSFNKLLTGNGMFCSSFPIKSVIQRQLSPVNIHID